LVVVVPVLEIHPSPLTLLRLFELQRVCICLIKS
jgi:hypothetical protein